MVYFAASVAEQFAIIDGTMYSVTVTQLAVY